MKFLNSSERLKDLRIKLKMTQQDLQEAGVTRNFISMVECGKKKLSRKTAKRLVPILKEKANKLGIPMHINLQYLLADPIREAEIYCFRKLNESNNNIEDVKKLSDEYNLKKVWMHIFIKEGNNFYDDKQYIKAFKKYSDALEICLNTENRCKEVFILNKLAKCRIMLSDYNEAIIFLEKANKYSLLYKDMYVQKSSYYNLGLCFNETKEYYKSIHYIDEYLKLCNEEKEFNNYINANIIKANNLRDIRQFDKSIELYNILIEKAESDDKLLGFIYSNLGILYFELDDLENCIEFIQKSRKIREKIKDENLYRTLVYEGKLYVLKNELDKAEEILLTAFQKSMESEDMKYIILSIDVLEKIYFNKENYNNMIKLYEQVLDKYNKRKDTAEILKIYIKLSLLKLQNNNIEHTKKILQESIEFNIDDVKNLKNIKF